MLGAVFADEARQGVDGGEALIAGSDAAVTTGFKIRQKLPNLIGGNVLDREPIDFLMHVA
jgi:hypothetical protein